MSKCQYYLSSKVYLLVSLFIILEAFSFTPSYAVHRHHKATATAQNKKTSKIFFSPQPGSILEGIARQLNQTDINFAVKNNEKPLILIGISNLSSTKTVKKVLFVELQSASLCGSGGCTTTAYTKLHGEWVNVLDSVTGDITVQTTAHDGMYDLLIGTSDVWVWNKNTYVASQRGPRLKGFRRSIENHQEQKQ